MQLYVRRRTYYFLFPNLLNTKSLFSGRIRHSRAVVLNCPLHSRPLRSDPRGGGSENTRELVDVLAVALRVFDGRSTLGARPGTRPCAGMSSVDRPVFEWKHSNARGNHLIYADQDRRSPGDGEDHEATGSSLQLVQLLRITRI